MTDGPHKMVRRRTSGIAIAMALLIALAAGVAAGVFWHAPIRSWFDPGFTSATASDNAIAPDKPKQLWTCGMHPQVIREEPGACPICNMALTPVKMDHAAHDDHADEAGTKPADGERKVKYWWDPMMNPPYIADQPGKSPMGMDLLPVYEDEVSAGPAVTIDPVMVQNMGVRLAPVIRGPLSRAVRAVGLIEQPQPRLHDINLRVGGWVEKLYAHTEGMLITQGQPLFDLYSPEVLVAVEELISARRNLAQLSDDAAEALRRSAQITHDAAVRKLELWGIDSDQVQKLAGLDEPPRTITFASPVTAEVSQLNVVQGAAVMMGERVLQLADRSVVWLDAQVFAQDLPFIAMGQQVTAAVESMPGTECSGKVVFIHPQLDTMTRTALVRIELENGDLALRPGMYATVSTSAQIDDDAILVADEAVIDTGVRQIVFVALGEGKFEPRTVQTGLANADGTVQVLAGLAGGETVVTSGQFLLDAESRMREAIQKYLSQRKAEQQGPTAPTSGGPTSGAPTSGAPGSGGRP